MILFSYGGTENQIFVFCFYLYTEIMQCVLGNKNTHLILYFVFTFVIHFLTEWDLTLASSFFPPPRPPKDNHYLVIPTIKTRNFR